MAEQVIEELEGAFKQLTESGTALFRESKLKESRTTDGRLSTAFMAKYYTLRATKFEPYEKVLSELLSMQEEDSDAKSYLEESADVMMIPAVDRLMSKLDDMVFGKDRPASALRQPTEATDQEEQQQQRASPRRCSSPQRDQPPRRFASQETLEDERCDDNDYEENYNNNNRPAKRLPRGTAPVSEVDRSLISLLRKPEVTVDVFKGDALDFSRFMRQLESRVFPHCEDDEEKLTFLEQYTEGEPNRIVKGFAHLSAKGFQDAMHELQDRYGNPIVVSNHYLNKVLSFPSFKIDDVKSLDEFAMLLNECECATGSHGCLDILSSVANMQSMLRKLPIQLQDRFNRKWVNLQREGRAVEFYHLVQFIKDEARLVKNSPFGREALHGAQNVSTGSSSTKTSKQGTYNRYSKHRTNSAVANGQTQKVSDKKPIQTFL